MDKNENKRFIETAKIGDVIEAERLLAEGVDVDAMEEFKIPENEGRKMVSALHVASYYGHLDMVLLLLSKGASVDLQGWYGFTALHWSVDGRRPAIVKLLVEKGANSEIKDTPYGGTPLHLAAYSGYPEITQLLIDLGANIDCRDNEGRTPLHVTAYWSSDNSGHSETAVVVLQNHAEIDPKNKRGDTPLALALKRHDDSISWSSTKTCIKVLLEQGANKNLLSEELRSKLDSIDFKEPIIPIEVQALGPDYENRFRNVLLRGSCKTYRGRIMFVGAHGVGKTHLRRRMLEQEYVPERDLVTNGIERVFVDYTFHMDDGHGTKQDAKMETGAGFKQSKSNVHEEFVIEETAKCLHTDNEEKIDNNVREKENRGDDATDRVPELEYSSTKLESQVKDNKMRSDTSIDDLNTREVKRRKLNNVGSVDDNSQTDEDTYLRNVDWEKETLLRQKSIRNKGKLAAKPENKAIISIWDFGGQQEFYTTHQTFMTQRAVYVVVYNLSEDLNAKVLTRRQGITGKRDVEYGPQTQLEFLEYWLKSVHVMTRLNDLLKDSSSAPPVLIVGTHKDNLDHAKRQSAIKRSFQVIQEEIKKLSSYGNIHPHFFAIDNTSADDETSELIKAIKQKLSEQPYWGEQMPLSWLWLEETLHEVSKNNDKKCVSFQSVASIALEHHNFKSEMEVRDFLLLYHSIGVVLYFNDESLRDLVILDPQWLIDGFKSVITVPKYHKADPALMKYWIDLDNRGVLDEALVDDVWKECSELSANKKHLLAIMAKLDIIHPLPHQQKERAFSSTASQLYLVPCMLKLADLELMSQDHSNSAPPSIMYASEDHWFPYGLFHRLISCCLRKYKPYANKLFYDYACFVIDEDQCLVMSIHLHKTRLNEVLQLGVKLLDNSSASPWMQNTITVASMREYIEDQIDRLKDLYFPSAKFQYYVEDEDVGKYFTEEDIMTKDRMLCSKVIHTQPYRIWFRCAQTTLQDMQDTGSSCAAKTSNSSNEELCTYLQKNHTALVDNLEPDSVLDYLFERNTINQQMLEEIRGTAHKTKTQKVRDLLDLLPKRGPGAISIFKEALDKTGQGFIDGLDISRHKEENVWLQSVRTKHISDVDPGKLLDHLLQSNAITREQLEKLEGKGNKTRYDIVRDLLDTLSSRGPDAVQSYKNALVETNQSYLLNPKNVFDVGQ